MERVSRQLRSSLWLVAVCLLGCRSTTDAAEIRGLWVDAYHPGFKSHAEVTRLLSDVRAAHFNSIFVEVRKRGDAYYQSQCEPVADEIPAGYDPLGDILAQAHQGFPRIEVHAWMVAYPVWNSRTGSPSATNHPYNLHHDWLTQNEKGETWDGMGYSLDPGHPEVQQHLYQVAMDILSRYDVDGLHLDYIRYSGRNWGYNPIAVSRFNIRTGREGVPAPTDTAWLQFLREQVTAFVRKIYLNAIELKPAVKFSAAAITFAPVISTTEELPYSSAFSNVLQDWRSWLEEGILDLNVPMAYFRQGINGPDWYRWSEFAKNHRYRRQVAVGLGFFLNAPGSALRQLRSIRESTLLSQRADGLVGYSYATLGTNAARARIRSALVHREYKQPELPIFERWETPPDMAWKLAPTTGHLKGLIATEQDCCPLDGASIELCGPTNRTLISDATGFYGAVDLPPGTYAVSAKWGTWQSELTNVTVAVGAVAECDWSPHPDPEELMLADLRVTPSTNTALVTWQTAGPVCCQLFYGLTPDCDQSLPTPVPPEVRHSVSLAGLESNRDYFLRMVSQRGTNESRLPVHRFHTLEPLAVTAATSGAGTSASSPGASSALVQKLSSSTSPPRLGE